MQDDLTDQYLNSLPAKMDAIRSLLRQYRTGNSQAARDIRSLAHSLHGSGATYGFPEISEAGKAVEHSDEAQLIKKLTNLVGVLNSVYAGSQTKEDSTHKSILLIEDDADTSTLIKSSIAGRSGAYQVYLAETAAQAQEYLVKQEFSLIVLDLVLPDRDGREILREIKYDFKLATPVLVLSAITRDEVRIECMSLGAEKFFTKPFAADELAEKVEDLLGKSTKPELSLVPLDGETQEEPVTAAKAQNPELLGKSVLVAEDDSMQANLIRQRLLKEGLEVKHAENGQLALDALHHKQFSLIILDVNMPVIDGFDVLKQIRKEPVTRDIPVIMLTAMGSENDIIRGYDLGANDYILKPFSPVQLLARVKSLLKKKDTVPLSR